MRFTIEQTFLTDAGGKPLGTPPPAAYHRVEAETIDAALDDFLAAQQATLIGNIQRFPGSEALATAQQRQTLFTIHVAPGSDAFRALGWPPRDHRDDAPR
ncbi:MAG TPA: hypothetical protein VJZ00_22410 [Thermoanaerobaculia bacterium]|nr:hypothetical protein [Thermoanaerobaculia bacterium]